MPVSVGIAVAVDTGESITDAPVVTNYELREDGGIELREDGGIELRE